MKVAIVWQYHLYLSLYHSCLIEVSGHLTRVAALWMWHVCISGIQACLTVIPPKLNHSTSDRYNTHKYTCTHTAHMHACHEFSLPPGHTFMPSSLSTVCLGSPNPALSSCQTPALDIHRLQWVLWRPQSLYVIIFIASTNLTMFVDTAWEVKQKPKVKG